MGIKILKNKNFNIQQYYEHGPNLTLLVGLRDNSTKTLLFIY